MFGIDNTILGLIVIAAGVLIFIDYFVRDKEKTDPAKRKEQFLNDIEKNKMVLDIIKKYDPEGTFKGKPSSNTLRICRKVARTWFDDPSKDLDKLISEFRLDQEPKSIVIRDTMLYFHMEQYQTWWETEFFH